MRFFDDELNLYYEKYDNHIKIVEGDHSIEQAIIPDSIDELPVTSIAKKAFLGCKLLKEISVPDSVSEIGDYAFAMCDHLQTVHLPCKQLHLGQNLFKNDLNLSQINIRSCPNQIHTSYLLAAATIEMDADYLVDSFHAGNAEWFKMWDQKLTDILNRKDDEGYHLYVLCGEEDLHFDYDQYVEYIREKKSGLCILRLLNDSLLDDKIKNICIDFLVSHIEIGDTRPVFNYLLKSHGDDEAYYEILIKYNIINTSNREILLAMMGDRHLQTKTYLINAFDTSDNDFFGDFML